jgi:spore maturation protein CgeB
VKVLIPNFAEPDSFVDNVASTLRTMGHEVVTSPRLFGRGSDRLQRLVRELKHHAFPQQWSEAETWAVRAARETRPELVLCLTQSLRQEALAELRRAGAARLVSWWGDPPANMQGMGLLQDGWDLIFLKDAAAVRKFQAVGLEAHHLNEAMNPTWHRRNFGKISDEVVVAGSYYGYRQFLVARLLEAGVPMALYGRRPPRWSAEPIKRAHWGRYVTREEKSLVFGSGLACLNSTSLAEGASLNCRAFEIAGACGLQLIEDSPSVASCFEPGLEVLTYGSVDDIHEHLGRARKDRGWAMELREAGHRRANAEHTYAHRLADIFRHLEIAAA